MNGSRPVIATAQECISCVYIIWQYFSGIIPSAIHFDDKHLRQRANELLATALRSAGTRPVGRVLGDFPWSGKTVACRGLTL